MQLSRFAVTSVIALAAMSGAAFAQGVPEGRVYTFHSKAQAGCPALDWHVVVGANSTLSGMVAWDDMKAMARASGTLDAKARTFQMTANEVGGQGRSATIDGKLRQDGWLVANIKGPNVDCKGINIPWFVAPPPGRG